LRSEALGAASISSRKVVTGSFVLSTSFSTVRSRVGVGVCADVNDAIEIRAKRRIMIFILNTFFSRSGAKARRYSLRRRAVA
jgi:hypothetical protein